jgi:hypothetical protein
MTFAIIVLGVLSVFVILFKALEDKLVRVSKRQRDSETRIGGLEVKDYAQDVRLDHQQQAIKRLNKEVGELGKDVGWDDDRRKTNVIKPEDPDDAA